MASSAPLIIGTTSFKHLTNLGLAPYHHDPCVHTRILHDSPVYPFTHKPVYVGIYVDDFIFFSENDDKEAHFA
jgi:hypothetical protein